MCTETVQVVVPFASDALSSIDDAEINAVEAINQACQHRNMLVMGSPHLVWEGSWDSALKRGAPTSKALRDLGLDVRADASPAMRVALFEASATPLECLDNSD